MKGRESKAIFRHYHHQILLRLEQISLSRHELIIKLLCRDYSQDDEKLVAKCTMKQEDYKGLYFILL